MAHQFIFTMKDLRKIVPPKREILKGIWLSFYPGAKIGVLGAQRRRQEHAAAHHGRRGQGLPRRGVAAPTASASATCRRSRELDPAKDVRGNVEEGVGRGARRCSTRFDEINARLGEPMDGDEMEKLLEEQARVQDAIEAANGWDLDRTVEIAMDALRVPPGDADVATLSGGERRRVALCRLLLQKPDMLLLDEPTNHLDAESVAWLERYLKEYPGTVVAITHDRYFLDNVAGWILELDRGAGIPWEGNYSSWLEQKQQRLAQRGEAGQARQRTLERELEWVRMSPRARQAKSKARLASYEELLAEDRRERDGTAEIVIPTPGRASATSWCRPRASSRATAIGCSSTISRSACPRGGIVGRHRRRTARARPRCSA